MWGSLANRKAARNLIIRGRSHDISSSGYAIWAVPRRPGQPSKLIVDIAAEERGNIVLF